MKFKPEDFATWKPHALSGMTPDCEDMADMANARLAEMLKKAPVVKGFADDNGLYLFGNQDSNELVSHTARLVNIEEIGK